MSRSKAVQTDQTYCSQNTLPIIFMNNLKEPIYSNNNLPLIKKELATIKPKNSIQIPKQTIQARDIIQKYYQQHDMKSFFNNRPGYKPNIETPYKNKNQSIRYSHVKPRVNTNLGKRKEGRSVSISFEEKSRTIDVKKSTQYRKIVSKTNTPKMSLYLQPIVTSKDQLILPRINDREEKQREKDKQEQKEKQRQSHREDYISTEPLLPLPKTQPSTKQLKDQSSQTIPTDKNKIISYDQINSSFKPPSSLKPQIINPFETITPSKIEQKEDQEQDDEKQISGISKIRHRKNSLESQAFSVMTKPNFDLGSRFGQKMMVRESNNQNGNSEGSSSPNKSATSSGWRKEINPQITVQTMEDLLKQFKPKSDLLKDADITTFKIKKYKNGVYFGQLIKTVEASTEQQTDIKNGLGCIFYYNGRLYQGQFQKDLKNGKGYELYPDSSYYHGDFKNGYKQGKGIFVWNNGEIYWGEWSQGKKHGSGTWKGSQGKKQSYFGQWYNGKPHGFGVLTNAIGDVYQGQFKLSIKDGKGTERYINGDVYVGQYLKGRRNGPKQTMYYKNGQIYIGEFCNNVRHGHGIIKGSNEKVIYQGEFQNDKKSGHGMLWLANGVYQGNFQNDLMHGFGKVIGYNHRVRNGYWINGKQLFQNKGEDKNNSIREDWNNENNTSIEKMTERYKSRNYRTLNSHNRSLEIEEVSKHSIDKGVEKKQMRSVQSDSKFADLKRVYLTKQKKNNVSVESKYKRRACGCLKKV